MYLRLETQTLVLNMCYRSGFYQYIGIANLNSDFSRSRFVHFFSVMS